MSRIPMAIASTLVVLAALGVAHWLVFRGSNSQAEAAPPPEAHGVTAGVSEVVPAVPLPSATSNSRSTSRAIHQLYEQARSQKQIPSLRAIRVHSGDSAEAGASNVAPLECCSECPCEKLTNHSMVIFNSGHGRWRICGGAGDAIVRVLSNFDPESDSCGGDEPAFIVVSNEAPPAWWTCGEFGATIVRVLSGRTHEDDSCCGGDEPAVAQTSNQAPRCRTAEAKQIDDFAARDEYPLGRIVAEFGGWFQIGDARFCPFCEQCESCPAGKLDICDCPEATGIVNGRRVVNPSASPRVQRENCPGAEGEGRPYVRSAAHEVDDRDLAEQIGQIEEIRRERNGSLLKGTLLQGDDENETHEFGAALRLVAGFARLVEGESVPPPPPGFPAEGFSAPPAQSPELPSVDDPVLVDVLRQAGRLLDLRSHDLEDTGRYEEADHLRALAQAVRQEARKAGPGGSEGGCGLFCPATAARPMCAPSIERSAKRKPVVKEGPVEKHY